MALGTSIGGWKIIKTMGTKIFKIEPINGFAADITSASVILTATLTHLPVSTTHVITSAILGVGSAKRFSAVKWGIGRTDHRIVDYYDTDHDDSGGLDLQGYCFVYVIGLKG